MLIKYKILLAFALGFVLATGIGIYKQKSVAGKANVQISKAQVIISSLQDKQKELEDLKTQIQQERLQFQHYNQSLEDKISDLQNGVFVMPPDIQMTIGDNKYSCKLKQP